TAAITFLVWRRGRNNFRFPFYTPKGAWFNPLAFPSSGRPLLSGGSALMAWQGLRFSAYGILVHWFIGTFVKSYAASVLLVSLHTDPRLKQFNEELQEAGKARRAGGRVPTPSQQPAVASDPASSTQDGYGDGHGGGQERSQPHFGRDGSGASGAAGPVEQGARGAQSWSSMTPEEALRRGQEAQQAQAAAMGGDRQQRAASEPTQSPAWSDDDALFDDASPVAPQHRQQNAQPAQQAGSSWDRIRSQSIAEAYSQQQKNPRNAYGDNSGAATSPNQSGGEQEGGGYSFSSAEEDKVLAKEGAQKEFDAMLERERRGGAEDRKWR
ncbi:MAG: hypothetical protein OK454_10985, partial [Thaumarchaeota archaeon]|nr:hypothetical protein [Nitrososphaerota archaeon]